MTFSVLSDCSTLYYHIDPHHHHCISTITICNLRHIHVNIVRALHYMSSAVISMSVQLSRIAS